MTVINKKVCMLGEFSVGKTSLIRRFVHERFDDAYLSTVGVKVSRKSIVLPKDGAIVDLTMMLWDLAGSEEFSQLRASYLRGTMGAVLVCDLTRPETLSQLQNYVESLHALNLHVPLVIAANKLDLTDQLALTEAQVAEVAGSLTAPYYLTSAKQGEGVELFFRDLGQRMIEHAP